MSRKAKDLEKRLSGEKPKTGLHLVHPEQHLFFRPTQAVDHSTHDTPADLKSAVLFFKLALQAQSELFANLADVLNVMVCPDCRDSCTEPLEDLVVELVFQFGPEAKGITQGQALHFLLDHWLQNRKCSSPACPLFEPPTKQVQ